MSWFFRRLPEIVASLPSEVTEAEPIFDARVKDRFPMGTSQDELKAELQEQGFRLSPAYPGFQDATFRRRFPPTTTWSIRWKADRGKLTDVWGVPGSRRS